MITVSFIARGVTWGQIQHSREEEADPRIPWVGVWRWSTYEMSADFSSFFHVSESIRSPVTMSIFICRLCLTPVGELISWIPEAEGSFSLLAPMRLLRNFFMKLMLNTLYCLQLLYQKNKSKSTLTMDYIAKEPWNLIIRVVSKTGGNFPAYNA